MAGIHCTAGDTAGDPGCFIYVGENAPTNRRAPMIDSIPALILVLLPLGLTAIIAIISAFTMEDPRDGCPPVNQLS